MKTRGLEFVAQGKVGFCDLGQPPEPGAKQVLIETVYSGVTNGTERHRLLTEHGHGKGHSVIGATTKWLRHAITSGLNAAVRALSKPVDILIRLVLPVKTRRPSFLNQNIANRIERRSPSQPADLGKAPSRQMGVDRAIPQPQLVPPTVLHQHRLGASPQL